MGLVSSAGENLWLTIFWLSILGEQTQKQWAIKRGICHSTIIFPLVIIHKIDLHITQSNISAEIAETHEDSLCGAIYSSIYAGFVSTQLTPLWNLNAFCFTIFRKKTDCYIFTNEWLDMVLLDHIISYVIYMIRVEHFPTGPRAYLTCKFIILYPNPL